MRNCVNILIWQSGIRVCVLNHTISLGGIMCFLFLVILMTFLTPIAQGEFGQTERL